MKCDHCAAPMKRTSPQVKGCSEYSCTRCPQTEVKDNQVPPDLVTKFAQNERAMNLGQALIAS